MLRKFLNNKTYLILAVLVWVLFVAYVEDLRASVSLGGSLRYAQFQDFTTYFAGIVVEATPFIFLGVLVSALFSVFIDSDTLLRFIPKNRFGSHLALALIGVFMPVCECGNVPVARGLIGKKLSVSQSMTFLLAAPILNPVTLYVTYEAFNFDLSYLWIRAAAALFIAVSFGLLISLVKDQNAFLNQQFYKEVCEHKAKKSKFAEFASVFGNEFWSLSKMLFLGAFLAAMFQVVIPRDIITSIGSDIFLSVASMILLAFVISICSNVDAFFALSFVGTFSKGALLSFLVFGPMVDIKILTMLRGTFSAKLLLLMTVYVTLISASLGILINWLVR